MNLNEIKFTEIGNVGDINELKKVIIYLLNKLDTVKYKTEIIKLCFVLDYLYCKEYGVKNGPTTVDYVKYNYGPYSDKFIEAFEELKKEGKIVEVSLQFGIGYSSTDKTDIITDEKIKKIAEEVISRFGTTSLREIKDFIYNLEEFNKTEFGKNIVLNLNGN